MADPDNLIFDESFDDLSFTFSEPDDQPESIKLDISEGSPLNDHDFTGAHFNINSIKAPGRLEELNNISNILKLDYLVINESKIDESFPTSLICLTRFHEPVRRDRNRHGGGCLIYVAKHLTFKQQNQFQSEHFEHIWVDIRVKDKTISINALYRPPNETADDHALFLQETEKILSHMLNHKSLASDLNFGNISAKNPSLPPKPLDNSAPELFKSFGLSQLVDIPTRVTENTTSLIDLIFCRLTDNLQCHGTLPKIADHDGTFVSFHCSLVEPKPRSREVFDYKNLDENALINYIKNIDFETLVFSRPVTEQAEAMTNLLVSTFHKFVPTKKVIIRPNDQPWVNSYTRLLLRKKNRNYDFYKKINNNYLNYISKSNTSQDIVTRLNEKRNNALKKSKIASNESTKANRRAKESFFNTISATMHNYNISAKKKFSILSKLMRTNKVSSIPPLLEGGDIINDPEAKSNFLNKHFASKASLTGADDPAPILPIKDTVLGKLSIVNTSRIEVAKLCRDIKKSNSSHCGVSGKFLSIISTPISFPLSRMFNNMFDIGYFPEIFKIGHITALFKGKGLKSDKENYRGIHLLPTLSKVAESVMHARLLSHFSSNNIISERQAAYMKGDSTVQQLLYIVHLIKSSWTKGKITQGCFLDVSAAFDKCWVNGVLTKLQQVKVEGSCLTLFESYLTQRKICTVVDGEKSDFLEIKAGVPQGSRLGPLLWILYVQDIMDELESEVLLFADDTCLFFTGDDPAITAEVLNRDLLKISSWAEKWKVIFNSSKSKDIIFSNNKPLSNSPPLILNNAFITRTHEHKHLGLWLSSNLDWQKQVHEACLKANGKLAVLRSVKFLDRSTLDLLYKLTVRSVLEYGMIAYYHCLKPVQLRKLSQVQYRAAKLCTGALHFSSQLKLEQDLAWESLDSRADFLGLTAFHKMRFDQVRPLVKSCMPVLRIAVQNTRSTEPYIPFKFQNQQFSKSFFPHMTNLYNALSPTLRNCDISDFKTELKAKLKPTKNKHFNRGVSKFSNSLHTQLRVGRSYLAAHGFSIGLNNSDKCACLKQETTEHFLISCPIYTNQRTKMFNEISLLLPKFSRLTLKEKVKTMLSGIFLESSVPDLRNVKIVFIVQNYILQTRRFASPPSPPGVAVPTPGPGPV